MSKSARVSEGVMASLADNVGDMLNTPVSVWRSPKGKGWTYGIVFTSHPGFNHLINRNGLTADETKRLLALLSDMCAHRIIGPVVNG